MLFHIYLINNLSGTLTLELSDVYKEEIQS